MHLPADVFLALRYLRPKRTFISVITLLSILGPILGVALLIIVISVMSGFDRDIRTRILSMQAHVQIFPGYSLDSPDARNVFDSPGRIVSAMESAGVSGSPMIEGPVLIQSRNRILTKYVKGIIPESEKSVTDISESTAGRFEIVEGEAVIGKELSLELGLGVGDQLLIHSPHRLTENISWDESGRVKIVESREVYLPEQVTVAGIFNMGVYEYDRGIILVHLDQAAELFGFDWGSATSVNGRVSDPFQMQEQIDALRSALPHCRIITWQQANRQLFGALRVEKNLMFFLMAFIVVVAAFGIAGTLITVAVQKTGEIGILKAVGMSSWLVARLFLLQGAVIGLLGTLLGSILGLTIIHFRNPIADLLGRIMGVEVFPKELYALSQIPAWVTRTDVAVIVGLALAICLLASVIPALYASFLPPSKALQDEN